MIKSNILKSNFSDMINNINDYDNKYMKIKIS